MANKLGGLEESELHILALLKSAPAALDFRLRQGLQIPRKLLEFALLRRDEQGELALLPAGERLLFQVRCIHTLQSYGAEGVLTDQPEVDADARAWLVASRFLDCRTEPPTITRRGHDWLASLDTSARLH